MKQVRTMKEMTPQFHTVVNQKEIAGNKKKGGGRLIRYVLKHNPLLFINASCVGISTDVFYPAQEFFTHEEERLFERMCSDCPAMMACLEWGLAHERYGVWGGTTPPMRHKIRKKIGWDLTDPSHS